MIFVKNVNEKDFAVRVRHNIPSRFTDVEIFSAPTGEKVDVDGTPDAQATSYCHPYENFSRAAGRRLAVKRALHQLIPRNGRNDIENANARADFWAQYNMQVG